MAIPQTLLAKVPQRWIDLARQHRELCRFAVVGGSTFIVDILVTFGLKWTILEAKPVTARAIGVIVAVIAGYILNREWSFCTRGGRELHHEAALYFLISGVGVVISTTPMLVARYWLKLAEPHVSWYVQECSDFASGLILGTLLAMVFRWWAFRKWVFPAPNVRAESSIAKKPELRSVIPHTNAQRSMTSQSKPAVSGR